MMPSSGERENEEKGKMRRRRNRGKVKWRKGKRQIGRRRMGGEDKFEAGKGNEDDC